MHWLSALCAAVSVASAVGSKGCGERAPAIGTQRVQVNDPIIGVIERSYELYIPGNYDEYQQTAVVIDFHGYYDTGQLQAEQSGIKEIADRYNFMAVWPNGLDDTIWEGQDAYSWNAVGTVESPGPFGDTCKWPAADQWNGYACHKSCQPSRGCRNSNGFRANGCDCSTCADDLLFVSNLLDDLESKLCVDVSRIFVAGMSNGAMMTYGLAQSKLASRIAAISPVAGSPLLGFGALPSVPMPIMEIHGSKDSIIPANLSGSYQGEVGPNNSTVSSDGFYYEQVYLTMDRYAEANGCRGELSVHYPTRFDGDTDLWCVTYEACSKNTVRCSFTGGHTWPFGNGIDNREKYALLIWEFFTAASKMKEGATGNHTQPTAARSEQ